MNNISEQKKQNKERGQKQLEKKKDITITTKKGITKEYANGT